jgi:hypothetical protein
MRDFKVLQPKRHTHHMETHTGHPSQELLLSLEVRLLLSPKFGTIESPQRERVMSATKRLIHGSSKRFMTASIHNLMKELRDHQRRTPILLTEIHIGQTRRKKLLQESSRTLHLSPMLPLSSPEQKLLLLSCQKMVLLRRRIKISAKKTLIHMCTNSPMTM